MTGAVLPAFVRLRGLQNVRRQHQQSRMRLIQDLRRLTSPQNTNPDEAAIRTTSKPSSPA